MGHSQVRRGLLTRLQRWLGRLNLLGLLSGVLHVRPHNLLGGTTPYEVPLRMNSFCFPSLNGFRH